MRGDDRVAVIHELDGVERPAMWHPLTGERRNYSTDLPGEMDVSGWYPDAGRLLVSHWHDGRSQLYRSRLDSGQYQLVARSRCGYITGAGVRPDGDGVAARGGRQSAPGGANGRWRCSTEATR